MSDSRLRIATRIHYLLARHLGDGIDIGAMLRREDYAREVLYVCEATDDAELHGLVAAWKAAPALDPALALRPRFGADAAPQDAAWAQDTSGFGVSQPPAFGARHTPTRPKRELRWYQPSTWFGALHD